MLTYSETILFPVGIYLFEVRYKNTKTGVKYVQHQEKKTPKRCQLT